MSLSTGKRVRSDEYDPSGPSYQEIMKDLRFKLKTTNNEKIRRILDRSSVRDNSEIQLHQVASYQAYNRHIIDFLFPSHSGFGEIVSFGGNDGNTLGLTTDPDAEVETEYAPTVIPKKNLPNMDIKMIDCGGSSSFALTSGGEVYAWGVNDEGQLGRGDIHEDKTHTIGKVPLENIIQVAAGNCHTVFLDVNGQVYGTGQYYTQEYGKWRDANSVADLHRTPEEDRDFVPNTLPIQLLTFEHKVIQIAAGTNFSAALFEDGVTLVTWGLGFDGELARSQSGGASPTDNPKDGKHRTFDYEKPMIGKYVKKKDKDGKEYDDFVPETDKVFNNFLLPKKVDWDKDLKVTKRHILNFACGDSHLLVVARDTDTFETRVYSAGRNASGQLGLGDETNCHYLTPIKALDNKRICKVTAGANHSVALNMMGDNVWTWGSSNYAALGLYKDEVVQAVTTPQLIAFPRSIQNERIIDIASGDNTNFAITNMHNVYSWGFNVYGQAGFYSDVMPEIRRPRKLDPMETAKLGHPEATTCHVLRAACGGQHSLLLVKRFK